MKKVAIYARVSTDEQAKFGLSIDAQLNNLIEHCNKNNYEYDTFVDNGISASSMKRPALQEMLKKISNYDLVLFTKLDRLSRNVLDANNINKILLDNKVYMKAIHEDDIDTSSADGTFLFNLKVSLAQREIEKTSERIKDIFKYKREKGEVVAGAKKYGYDIIDKHFVINKIESENIVNFYKYFILVAGDVHLSHNYFKEHFKNSSYQSYNKYLQDTSYIGKYKLYLKDEYIENYIPAIVDEELFNKVQNFIKKRRRSTRNNAATPITIFDGFLKCGNCNSKMCRSLTKSTNNTIHVNYRCYKSTGLSRYKDEIYKCTNKRVIVEKKIEKQLLDMIQSEIKNQVIKLKVINNKKVDTKIIKEDIKKIEKKLEKLKDLYLENLIDKELYKKDYNEYMSTIEKLKIKLYSNKNKSFEHLEKFIDIDFNMIYNKLDKIEKRKFWMSILNEIILLDGKIIKLNFVD